MTSCCFKGSGDGGESLIEIHCGHKQGALSLCFVTRKGGGRKTKSRPCGRVDGKKDCHERQRSQSSYFFQKAIELLVNKSRLSEP